MRIVSLDSGAYLIRGLSRRLTQGKQCPCCFNTAAVTVDRKFFHTLEECPTCGLVFRFPSESESEANAFYQTEYAEPGLTTELPTSKELNRLISTKFKGSPKDFTRIIDVLRSLGLSAGNRVLDYGANWGYGTWQLIEAGFEAMGFELSTSRARFGKELGLEVVTDVASLVGDFDAVYSGHVLEHVPNPAEVLQQHLQWTRPGGFVVAHTPNGSRARRENPSEGFRHAWGRVHPVLLTERFIVWLFKNNPFYVSSSDEPGALASWDRESQHVGKVEGPGLFFVVRNSRVSASGALGAA